MPRGVEKQEKEERTGPKTRHYKIEQSGYGIRVLKMKQNARMNHMPGVSLSR
jgi:hypothetical protein